MKIIDASGAILGRLASFVAKELLKGEEIAVVNCDEIMITGNKKNILENFRKKRSRVGSSQKGPKYPRETEKIVKRAIRGMLPNYRQGRGRAAFKRIKCYKKVPEEFKNKKMISMEQKQKIKLNKLKEVCYG